MADPPQKMKLYHTKTFLSSRCTWLIHELGVQNDFDIVLLNPYGITDKEKEEYMSSCHMHGQVPTLVLPNGHVMVESVAINMYLAQKYKKLLPSDEYQSDYYLWSVYSAATLDSILQVFVVANSNKDNPEKGPSMDSVAKATRMFNQFAQRFNAHLEGKSFICGDRITAADMNMGITLYWFNESLLSPYPNIQDYLGRLKARPAFHAGVIRPDEDLSAILRDLKHKPYIKL